MYDRSEAAMHRIISRVQTQDGDVGRMYVHLARTIMHSVPPSPSRDRALKRLADSCDDAMSTLEKRAQSARRTPSDSSSTRQTAR